MANEFSRTLRSIEHGGGLVTKVAAWSAIALGVSWLGWMVAGTTHVYAATPSARVEVEQSAYAVQPDVDGLIVQNELRLGRRVQKGDVLLVLEDAPQRLQLERQRLRLDSMKKGHEALKGELDAENEALASYEDAKKASVHAARARTWAIGSSALAAKKENDIVQKLRESNISSGIEALRSQGTARSRLAETSAAYAEAKSVSAMGETEEKDRQVRVTRLDRLSAELEGDIKQTEADIKVLEWELSRRTLRAATDGALADTLTLTPGATVKAGQKVASIVPDSGYRVVALFEPDEAVGRLAPGQRGILRLDGFPWAQYGVIHADVQQVASEPRDGRVRVELALPDQNGRIPLSHGLTGTLEVETERVSPGVLLLRAAGQALAGPVKKQPPKPAPTAKPASSESPP